jgi:hypothetical protein
MSLGLRRSLGTILPRLKYDTRIGFFLTEDRVKDLEDKWFSEQKNIEREDFRATVDLETLQVGWLNFPSGAPPDTKLVAPGEDWNEAPSKQHKLGLRLLLKLDKTIDNSGARPDVHKYRSVGRHRQAS